jgi:hypothetical protein
MNARQVATYVGLPVSRAPVVHEWLKGDDNLPHVRITRSRWITRRDWLDQWMERRGQFEVVVTPGVLFRKLQPRAWSAMCELSAKVRTEAIDLKMFGKQTTRDSLAVPLLEDLAENLHEIQQEAKWEDTVIDGLEDLQRITRNHLLAAYEGEE